MGGLSSLASGGNFVSGFAAAGVSQAASVYGVYGAIGAVDQPQSVGGYLWNSAAAGMVGGTASVAAGGSFEQGAITASMGRLFNDLSHVMKISPALGALAAVDGPLPIGDAVAVGAGAAALIYGDDAIDWIRKNMSTFNSDTSSEELSGEKDPSTPVGRRGSPLDVAPGTNEPAEIGGRQYTGHGLDRMQGRGVPPSAVEDAINNGICRPGKYPGTVDHVSEVNGIKVVTGGNGQVITVITK